MPESDELRRELADVAASLRAYLELQVASGASGIPRGALSPATTTPTRSAPVVNVASAPATAARTEPKRAAAREAVAARSTDPAVRLPQLAQEVAACKACGLHATRKHTVFARGTPESAICFIGEAPGAEEDEQGLPFVGRAGQLLEKMIGAMGLSPATDVYIINILRCRPPDNRRPEPDEIAACLPFLHEQLDLVKPKVIVALGNTAVGTLLGTKVGISKLRGQWKLYRGTTLVMPTYHPSYLLRPSAQQAEAKKQAWEDLQAVLTELKLPIPSHKKKDSRTKEEPE